VREHVRVFEEGQPVVGLGELSAMEIMEAGGLPAFWSGLVPGLQHHFLSGGVKIGLYDPIKTAVCTALPTGTSMLIVSALAGAPARFLSLIQSIVSSKDATHGDHPRTPHGRLLTRAAAGRRAAGKILSGMVCGVAGIAAANPTDVVKVRQQGRADDDAPLGNLLQQYAAVVRESGVLGLWAGFAPNAARSASISGLEFMGCVDSR
jgi:solute carrier family 25 uncoupling protein 8/9